MSTKPRKDPNAPETRGAPKGNQNAKKGARFRRMILEVLDKEPERQLAVVYALLDECANGNIAAIKELMDRTDGKVAQAHTVGGEDGGPIQASIQVTFVRPEDR